MSIETANELLAALGRTIGLSGLRLDPREEPGGDPLPDPGAITARGGCGCTLAG